MQDQAQTIEEVPEPGPCPDENALLEFADHGLAPADRESVAEHLDGCSSCRAVLVALVPSVAAPSAAVTNKAYSALPAEMLRSTLDLDAARRERVAIMVALGMTAIALLMTVSIGLTASGNGTALMVAVLGTMLATVPLHLVLLRAIGRGWYRPWVAYVNVSIETTMPMVIILFIGERIGAVAGLAAPAQMIWSAAVVFSALRASPAVSLVAGAVAALESVLLYLHFQPALPPELQALVVFSTPGAVLRAVFLLCSGAAAAALAWLQIRRAEQALRAVRMQDLMGKYVLHGRIGKGGMGEVFRATYCPEGGFTKTVAVKRVLARVAEDGRFVEAFREEARLGALLAHPNVVQVLDFGRFQDGWIFALEYVDGLSLEGLLHRGQSLTPAAITWLATELSRALHYIHTKRGDDGQTLGLVHRDLNPPNVLLSHIGEVKLGDFGVASALSRRAVKSDGTFAGKERWAAPEQLRGEALDGRADLYALGLTLAAALASGTHGSGRLRGLDRADCPARLRSVITSLLESDRERRPADARSVLERLEAVGAEVNAYPRGRDELARAVREARAMEATPLAARPLKDKTREVRGRTT